MTGLFARDGEGRPLVHDKRSGRLASALDADVPRRSRVPSGWPTGARRYRRSSFWPSDFCPRLRTRTRRRRDRDRRQPPSAASPASWRTRPSRRWCPRHPLDRLDRPPPREDDRPAGRHACHARHLGPRQRLSHLPHPARAADPAGLDRLPRRLPLQDALSQAGAAHPQAARQAGRGASRAGRCRGRIWASPPARRICWWMHAGTRSASTRPSAGKRRSSAHGLMHMVIANAARGDPYPIDVLFLYMANMGWNSSMNLPATLAHLTEKDPATGEYKIPEGHLLGRLLLRDGALRRPDPARHHLSRALGLHLAARPARSRSPTARRCHPPAGRGARPQRAAVPGRADRARRAAAAAGHERMRTARRNTPAATPTTSSITSAGPASARSPAIAARTAATAGRGEANPRQLEQYIADGCFHVHHLPEHMRYFQHVNRDYHRLGGRHGLSPHADAGDLPALQRADAKDASGGAWAWAGGAARASIGQRIETYFDPLPFWYRAVRGCGTPAMRDFPLHAITQRPMAMYHSWGSQNAWLRQIHGANRLYLSRARGRQARHRATMTGCGSQPHRPGEGAGEADGGRQPRHRVDLERHRQARRRLGPRSAGARGHARLPAQSPDRRAAAGAARRLPLLQQRPRHGPGRLVRPQGADREGGAQRRTETSPRFEPLCVRRRDWPTARGRWRDDRQIEAGADAAGVQR